MHLGVMRSFTISIEAIIQQQNHNRRAVSSGVETTLDGPGEDPRWSHSFQVNAPHRRRAARRGPQKMSDRSLLTATLSHPTFCSHPLSETGFLSFSFCNFPSTREKPPNRDLPPRRRRCLSLRGLDGRIGDRQRLGATPTEGDFPPPDVSRRMLASGRRGNSSGENS